MRISNNVYQTKSFITIFILIIIACSGYVLQTVVWQIEYLPLLGVLFVIIPIIYVLRYKPINIHTASFLSFVVMVMSTYITNGGESVRYYFLFLSIVTVAFGISLIYSFDIVVNLYLKLMIMITLVALAGYCLNNYTDVLQFLPHIKNLNDVEYSFGIIFSSIISIPERNCAIFWEPGLFATFLIYALVFEIIFKQGKVSINRILIFSIGIITAHSSAGYILFILSILLLLSKRTLKKEQLFLRIIKVIFFIIIICCIVNYEAIIYMTPLREDEYIQKLLPENLMTTSRMLAIKHNLEVFMYNPIFGSGISTVLSSMQNVADTSTSTYLLSIYGGLGGLYSIWWIYAIGKLKGLNIYNKIILFAIIFSILNKEPHATLLFTWCLLFWLIKQSVPPHKNLSQETLVKNER